MEPWTTIRYLQAQGVGIRAICRQLGVSRTAVRRVLRGDGPSHYQRRARPNQRLVRYEAQIHAWYFGQHLIGSRILRELRKLGYTGGAAALYAYLKQGRAAAPPKRTARSACLFAAASATLSTSSAKTVLSPRSLRRCRLSRRPAPA